MNATPSRMVRWLLWAAILAAPAAQFACIARLAPNAPYADDWAALDTTVGLVDGTATPRQLLATYCGAHKVTLTWLAIAAVSAATAWDLRAVMAVSLLFAALTFGLLARVILRQTGGSTAGRLGLLAGSACLFSLNQYAAFLWAWGIGYTLANLFVVAAVLVAAGPTGRDSPRGWRLAAAALCCLAATWSNGQGILSWGVMAVLALTAPDVAWKRRLVAAAVWLLLGGAAVALSYADGFDPVWKPTQAAAAAPSAAERVAQFLTVTGGLLQAAPPASVIAGLAILAAAVVPLADPPVRRPARPWVALAAYGVAFTAFTAVGRIDSGVGFQFRWSAIVALTTFAVIQLWAVWAAAHWSRPGVRAAAVVVALGITGVFALKSIAAVGHIRESWVPQRQATEATVAVGGLIPEAAGHEALADTPGVPTAETAAYAGRFAALERLGWRRVRAGFSPGPTPRAIEWRAGGNVVAASGNWTDDARRLVRGTHVLFLGDPASGVLIASRFVPPAAIDAPTWSVTFLVPADLAGRRGLAVWAYDRATGQLVPIAAPEGRR